MKRLGSSVLSLIVVVLFSHACASQRKPTFFDISVFAAEANNINNASSVSELENNVKFLGDFSIRAVEPFVLNDNQVSVVAYFSDRAAFHDAIVASGSATLIFALKDTILGVHRVEGDIGGCILNRLENEAAMVFITLFREWAYPSG